MQYIFLIFLSGALGHTWLESLRLIGSNGAFTGEPGFPRGVIARDDPAFSDDSSTYRITAPDSSTPLCHPSQQKANGYENPLHPRLNASAGSFIALQYQENGHTSAPQVPEGRPFRSGNVFVYASTSLKDEKLTSVHGNWTADGSLENGKLLSTHFFDDLICFQDQGTAPTKINAERKAASGGLPSVTCQTDVQIPQDIKSDVLALYWVWEWPLWANTDKWANETYTACSEVLISQGGDSSSEIVLDEGVAFDKRAVMSQLATQFEVLELGTGTAAPPLVTSLFPNTASAPLSTDLATDLVTLSSMPTTTVADADGHSGFVTVYVPSATVTVTVTAVAPP